jgi:hypothetical protein
MLDKPITDYELAKEVERAFWHGQHGRYPFMDSSIDPTNTIYNADQATIHRFDNILPWEVLECEILTPYRERVKAEQERRERERAEHRAKLEQQKADGKTASDDVKRKVLQAYYDAIFSNLAGMTNGRHTGLLSAGSGVANIKATDWASDYLDITDDADERAIQACKANDYYNDYAHSDDEVLRTFHHGLNTTQVRPLDEPLAESDHDQGNQAVIESIEDWTTRLLYGDDSLEGETDQAGRDPPPEQDASTPPPEQSAAPDPPQEADDDTIQAVLALEKTGNHVFWIGKR